MRDQGKNSYLYLYKRMFPYIKPYLSRFIIAMLITIPIGSLDAVIAWFLRPYMDVVLINKNLKVVWFVPLIIVGFTVMQGILNYIATYLNGWLSQKVSLGIKHDLYKKLLHYETSYFDKKSSGSIITRFSGDPDSVTNGILNNVRTLSTRIFSSIALIGVLIYNSWLLAIIAVAVILLILFPLTLVKKRVRYVSEGMVKTNGVILSHYNEAFSGNRVIASYNLQDHQLSRFRATQKDLFNLSMKMTKLNGWLTPFMYIVASIGVASVLGVGSYLIMTGKLTNGAFVSFITALILLYNPIKGIGNTALGAQASFIAMERVLELFDHEPKIKSRENPAVLEDVKNGIKFENVWFAYEQDKPILKDINLDVKVGETIALVGNSGGGKSTLVSLIPRFYDITEGRLTLDGIDLRDIEIHSLRDKIAIVFQDNFLFRGTIRDNIMIGKPGATRKEVVNAVKGAYLDEFIATLDLGLDTEIGERGVLLSGGQKQRVAIARALLKNAPIVILDEATSALDNKSEAIVQKAIDTLMQNRTVFVIAHRLSTVQNATRIIVIDDGQILEIGSHEELISKSEGRYKNLYYAQFKEKSNKAQSV